MVSGPVLLWLVPLAVMAGAALAERWHAGRVRRARWLAFGPRGGPRDWVHAVAPFRVLAAGALAWSLLVLLSLDRAPPDTKPEGGAAGANERAVILLDVSPSMQLADAGPGGRQTRADRAREVLRSLLDRMDMNRTRVSVVAFYSEARPVVVDTFDPEVVANILNDLPLEQAFTPGKTNVYAAVKTAGDIAKTWRPRSALLVLASDGDTLPPARPPELPEAYAGVLVLGIGNPQQGLFIDDHSSRQDAVSLKQLAARLSGTYLDVNSRHVPTVEVDRLASTLPPLEEGALEWRDVALAAALLASAILAFASPALAWAGGSWRRERGETWQAILPAREPART